MSSDGFRLFQHSCCRCTSLLYSETSTIRTQTPDRPNIITLHSFPPRSIFYNGKNKGGIDEADEEEEEEEGRNRGEGCPRSNGWGSRRRGSVARKCTGGGREEGEGLANVQPHHSLYVITLMLHPIGSLLMFFFFLLQTGARATKSWRMELPRKRLWVAAVSLVICCRTNGVWVCMGRP